MSSTLPTAEPTERLITAEEFEVMEFEFPVDLIKGRIEQFPPPGASHGRICMNVGFLLEVWSRSTGLGSVMTNDSAVVTDFDPDSVRGCDVLYVSWDTLNGKTLPSGALRVAPDLVVEVLSPSDRWSKVELKLEDYFTTGVKEIWVISIEDRVAWVCRPGQPHQRLEETAELTSPAVLPGFACRVVDFFLHV